MTTEQKPGGLEPGWLVRRFPALERLRERWREIPEVRQLSVTARTPTGRVKSLEIATDRSRFTLTGNDIRFVLRSVGGEMLNSTYFSVEAAAGAGDVGTLTLRGQGYGHGIGMCQWGAIGRARAGHDARTILAAYYPGTSVAPLR